VLRKELPAQQFNTWIRPLKTGRLGGTIREHALTRSEPLRAAVVKSGSCSHRDDGGRILLVPIAYRSPRNADAPEPIKTSGPRSAPRALPCPDLRTTERSSLFQNSASTALSRKSQISWRAAAAAGRRTSRHIVQPALHLRCVAWERPPIHASATLFSRNIRVLACATPRRAVHSDVIRAYQQSLSMSSNATITHSISF